MAERLLDLEQQGVARKLFAQINGEARTRFRQNYDALVVDIQKTVQERALEILQLGIFPTEKFAVHDRAVGRSVPVAKPAIYVTDVVSFDDEHLVITPDGTLVVNKVGSFADGERLFGGNSRPWRPEEVVLYANYAFTAMEGVIARALGASTPQEVLGISD